AASQSNQNISDLGFEMQDSSNFKIPRSPSPNNNSLTPWAVSHPKLRLIVSGRSVALSMFRHRTINGKSAFGSDCGPPGYGIARRGSNGPAIAGCAEKVEPRRADEYRGDVGLK